jgi:flagellar biosynthetic protein FliR
MSLLEGLLVGRFILFTLVLARVSGLVMTAPIFGGSAVPMRIRALLAFALSLLMLPVQTATPVTPLVTLPDYLLALTGELLIGLVFGLGIKILLAGIQLTGQIISQLSGLALADVFDPSFQSSVPVFSQLLLYVTLAVFVLFGGHRMVMAALLDTFRAIPPGAGPNPASLVDATTTVLAQSFVLGIRAAAPAMTALLLATLVLALISRTLPQINILAVGFGINTLVALATVLLSLGAISWAFQEEIEPVLDLIQTALTSGGL